MDVAATDILGIRELGVPRYNEFRRLLRLAPAKDFESLTDNPTCRAPWDGDRQLGAAGGRRDRVLLSGHRCSTALSRTGWPVSTERMAARAMARAARAS
jgi:Animal haem peroxidase